MILNKKELKYYLNEDKAALNLSRKRPRFFLDQTWRYLILMRKTDFYLNKGNPLFKLIGLFYMFRYLRKGVHLGIQIPINCFKEGLGLFHYGSIIVNSSSSFGKWCVIQSDTNVSKNVHGGDNVYIGAGAKIMKNITICSNVIIGANSVVTKSILEPGVYVGIPAKKIKDTPFIFDKNHRPNI